MAAGKIEKNGTRYVSKETPRIDRSPALQIAHDVDRLFFFFFFFFRCIDYGCERTIRAEANVQHCYQRRMKHKEDHFLSLLLLFVSSIGLDFFMFCLHEIPLIPPCHFLNSRVPFRNPCLSKSAFIPSLTFSVRWQMATVRRWITQAGRTPFLLVFHSRMKLRRFCEGIVDAIEV
jgi:hypothetical protein